MKATGIVRRIDDLGRVVIPKEIRRTMRIREGDPLEIFTNINGEVIFKKYSPLGELETFSNDLCETIAKNTNMTCAICDKDSVISTHGALKKELEDQKISNLIERILKERATYIYKSGEVALSLVDNEQNAITKVLSPIICDGDITGAVVLVDSDVQKLANEGDIKVLQTSAMFLAKHMSN